MVYNTKNKKKIVDFLSKDSDKRYTAEQITSQLFDNSKKSSVYRLISELCENQIVIKEISEEKNCATYRIDVKHCHDHYHFQCTECRAIFHLDDKYTNDILDKIGVNNGFEINKVKTIFYGICSKCKQNKGNI